MLISLVAYSQLYLKILWVSAQTILSSAIIVDRMGTKVGRKVFVDEMVVALQPNIMVKEEKEMREKEA